MPERVGTKLTRVASELAVIIVGVLIALAADETWAERGERQREAALLQDLIDEFVANDSLLQRDIATNRGYADQARRHSDALISGASQYPDSLSATLNFFGGAHFDAADGVLRSIMDGGELRLIRDPDLRSALATWQSRVEEVSYSTASSRDVIVGLLPSIIDMEGSAPLTQSELAALRTYRGAAQFGLPQLIGLRDHLAGSPRAERA